MAAAKAAGQPPGSTTPPGYREQPIPESGRLIGVSRETGCLSCPSWCAGARAPGAGARSGLARGGVAGGALRPGWLARRLPKFARAQIPVPALQGLETAGRPPHCQSGAASVPMPGLLSCVYEGRSVFFDLSAFGPSPATSALSLRQLWTSVA